ncbi:hypothetical protein ABPG77_004586 [Micractinium sp. CCAP 211/92]
MSQQTESCMDLTESVMEDLQAVCPGQVDEAQLSLITQYIAEGRRMAEEIRLLAQTPSQNSREAVNYALALMKVCREWCWEAQKQIERSLQLQRQQLGMEPVSFTAPAQPPNSASEPPAP